MIETNRWSPQTTMDHHSKMMDIPMILSDIFRRKPKHSPSISFPPPTIRIEERFIDQCLFSVPPDGLILLVQG